MLSLEPPCWIPFLNPIWLLQVEKEEKIMTSE